MAWFDMCSKCTCDRSEPLKVLLQRKISKKPVEYFGKCLFFDQGEVRPANRNNVALGIKSFKCSIRAMQIDNCRCVHYEVFSEEIKLDIFMPIPPQCGDCIKVPTTYASLPLGYGICSHSAKVSSKCMGKGRGICGADDNFTFLCRYWYGNIVCTCEEVSNDCIGIPDDNVG